jgi:ubiquinone biosynthesis protein
MKFTATHLKRYKEIASLFWRYGRSDLVKQMGMDADDVKAHEDDENFIRDSEKKNGTTTPNQLVDDLEAMGPTYVKIGQVLAGRPDLMPEPYRVALARLQDKVKPFPYEQVEAGRSDHRSRTRRAHIQGVRRIRAGADRRRVTRPGA